MNNAVTTKTTLEGVCNFRDLGGIRNREGRAVKHGLIFRTDELSRLTDADLRTLNDLPLRTIVDLRTESEIVRRPNRRPTSVRNMALCTLDTPGLLTSIAHLQDDQSLAGVDQETQSMLGKTDAKLGTLQEEEIKSAMTRLYTQMLVEPDFQAVYRRIFEMLSSDDDTPLLFHCMAGKDRTGIVAALILLALDVDEEAIMKDYLLSDIVLEKRYFKQVGLNPSLRPLYGTCPEFMQAVFDKIRNDYGNARRYLSEVIGVDVEAMKKRYTDSV